MATQVVDTGAKRNRRGSRGGSRLDYIPEMLVKAHAMGDRTIESGVSQSDPSEFENKKLIEPGEFIRPLVDLSIWAASLEQSTRLGQCVHLMARNIAGMGWEIVPGDDPNERATPQDAEASANFLKEKARLSKFFNTCNPRMHFSKVMELVLMDRESTGSGYLEVTRNAKGDIDGLYHAQSVTIRVLKGAKGYVQLRGGTKRYFKNFGDPEVRSVKTGKPADPKVGLPLLERATELIPFHVYSPRSIFYGLPRFAAAAPAVAGNRLSAMRNVNFFENDACPRLIITVSGGKLASASMDMIEAFLRKNGKGTANAHRALLLQAESKKMTLNSENKVAINVIPLTVGTTEDASFLQYRKANDEEIREAFGIAEAYFSTASTNRASAETGRLVTEQGVFEPERISVEHTLNHTVVAGIGASEAHLRLKRPSSLDPIESVNVDQRLASGWALTVNEMRVRQGLVPFEDKDLGNKPYMLTMTLLQRGIGLDGKPLPAAEQPGGFGGTPKAPEAEPAGAAPLVATPQNAASAQPGPKTGSSNFPPKPKADIKPNIPGKKPVEGAPRVRRKDITGLDSLDASQQHLVVMLSEVLKENGISPKIQVQTLAQALEA